jgi:hypothetical protein
MRIRAAARYCLLPDSTDLRYTGRIIFEEDASMPTLFDMLTNADNGKGIDLLARQFNINRQQAELAVEALLPAFSQGLKRNASDPYSLGAFMTALASGNHAKYFEDSSRAFSPDGVANGNDILGQLFGSKDLSRAVAAQAAQATGLGQDMLKQMLPAIAAMIMGGLFKQSTGQMQANQAGGFGGDNPLGQIIEEMMRQGGGGGNFGGQPRQQPQASPDPLDNPFGKVLKDMFGGGAQQPDAPQRRPMPSGADNPFGRIFEEMLGGGQRQADPQPEPQPEPQRPRANPTGHQLNPYHDIFGDMFETGRKTRDEYQKGVENVFDQFLKGMDRYR